ncbi:MAG TPA: hypothetical protein VNA69_16830 [Thermoanaerobaculia bacterium]|nr:hypothetical protein [Thermoanaerobaculia bacterium]
MPCESAQIAEAAGEDAARPAVAIELEQRGVLGIALDAVVGRLTSSVPSSSARSTRASSRSLAKTSM